jgi:dephospho-CoA kinase
VATVDPVPAVLITGTIGAGKTAVATDIGECLAKRHLPTAVVDLDWLGWVTRLPAGDDHSIYELILRNLQAVWPNFRSAGVCCLVLVRAIQSREEVDALREALPDARIQVVRLTASPGTIAERLRKRDTGVILEEHLSEASEFTQILDEIRIDDIQVENEDRSVREVAMDVLGRLGWS